MSNKSSFIQPYWVGNGMFAGFSGFIPTEDFSLYTSGTDEAYIEFVESYGQMAPVMGDIYDGATLIGNRDPITGVFTGVDDWELISDTPGDDNPLLIVDGLAQYNIITLRFEFLL